MQYPIWDKLTFVIIKNFAILSNSSYHLVYHCIKLFLWARCFKHMYLFYLYNNAMSWVVVFSLFLERKTMDLSYAGPFNKWPGWDSNSGPSGSTALHLQQAGILQKGLPAGGFSCSLGITELVFRHLFHFYLGWSVRDIPTASALRGVIWVYRTRVEVTYLPNADCHLPKDQEIYLCYCHRTQVPGDWGIESISCVSPEVEGVRCCVMLALAPAPGR